MPPMPPMPPIGSPGAPAGASGSGISATATSVVNSIEAIDIASSNDKRKTFDGSRIPDLFKSSYLPVRTLNPFFRRRISETTTSPLYPPFDAICLAGSLRAFATICIPVF